MACLIHSLGYEVTKPFLTHSQTVFGTQRAKTMHFYGTNAGLSEGEFSIIVPHENA